MRRDSSKPSEGESIEATAAAWLALEDDGMSPEEQLEFARWRAADVRHESAARRLQAAWGALQPLRDFRPEARVHPDRDLLVRPVAPTARGWFFPATALAAAAVVMLAIAWWMIRPGDESETATVFATTAGGFERVMLADRSVLELNGDTRVEVRFSPAERRARLVRGEAHFTVTKNPARPFSVEAGRVAVRAVGTAFNVRLGAREVEVLVTEGKVAVSTPAASGTTDPGGAADSVPAGQWPPSSLLVGAGERVTVPREGAVGALAAENVEAERIRQALAWQERRVFFAGTPLSEVVAQFNRYNRVQLRLGDAALAGRPVGGSFHMDNMEAFVNLLVETREVVIERPNEDQIVLRSRP